ncbi:MAG TPA: hypothetical protein VG106_12570, partial [Vicinamibacterales bacterium]|nr:hypothetical protein [Vicinamibacterales bacterium]
KWNPHTRETADHSLPYVVAVSLVDGAVTSRQFSDDRLADPALQAVTKSIEVVEDPDFTAAYPAAMPAHVEVHLANGTVESCAVEAPLGHGTRPMDEQAVHAKFVACGAQHRDSEQLEQMAAALLSLEAAPDVTEPMSTLAFAV